MTEDQSQNPFGLPDEARRPPPMQQRVRADSPESTPIFVYLIVGLNVLIFLFDLLLNRELTLLGMNDHPSILAGEYWRLFTSMFLHAGILHLGLNNFYIYQLGRGMERNFGNVRFVTIYILSGLAGSVASFALTQGSSIGASGALFGMIGAMVPYIVYNRQYIPNTRRQLSGIAQAIFFNLVLGITLNAGNAGVRIDNWAHIGGLIGGLILAFAVAPRYVIAERQPDRVRFADATSPVQVVLACGAFAVVLAGMFVAAVWWMG